MLGQGRRFGSSLGSEVGRECPIHWRSPQDCLYCIVVIRGTELTISLYYCTHRRLDTTAQGSNILFPSIQWCDQYSFIVFGRIANLRDTPTYGYVKESPSRHTRPIRNDI